jgi:hypothetical protein
MPDVRPATKEASMPDDTAHGPIDFVLIEFPEASTGATGDALMDLVERDVIHVYDLLVISKAEDGSFTGVDIDDLTADGVSGFTAFSGVRSDLLGDDDLTMAADAMKPGSTAALIVYENVWAVPFVAAARDAGGELIASQRIPAQDVIDALDALEDMS